MKKNSSLVTKTLSHERKDFLSLSCSLRWPIYILLLLIIIRFLAVTDASATTAASRKIEDSAFEVVKAMTAATLRDPRWSPPDTTFRERWTNIGTALIPPVTTVYPDLPPKNIFKEWSGAFIGADKEQLPMTLFLPSSEDPSPSPTYKIAAAYHIVPKKLLLADLLSMEVNSRLPTLVPGASIIVTNNLPLELNGVRVTDPEVFVSKSIVIHRIASPLDFTTVTEDFGGGETASWFSWLFIIVIPVSH